MENTEMEKQGNGNNHFLCLDEIPSNYSNYSQTLAM